MKWSLRLGTIAGIRVQLHVTFLLLLVFLGLLFFNRGGTLAAAILGLLFVLAVFTCVVLHEFGHALVARRFGIQTRDITLLPIGGLARLERMPDEPVQELWVALAGPAVNVVIAAVLGFWLLMSGGVGPDQILNLRDLSQSFAANLLKVNLLLVGFNLLPAFPMDGGRVLRALLATSLQYTRATQIAATIGQVMAVLFGIAGLFWFKNPILLIIALFVWIGAQQEASMVQMKAALSGIPVSQAMLTDFRVLHPYDSLAQAVKLTLKGAQKDTPVVDDGEVLGVVMQRDLLAALSQGAERPVIEIMQREFQKVDPYEMLEIALGRLRDCACHTLPVVRHGRLVGLLTMDNIGEFLAFQAALEGRGA